MSGTPFHLDVGIERYFFEKISQSEVDKKMIARAEDVRAFVCPDLKIEPPRIVWIRPAPPSSKRGALKNNSEEELDLVVRLQGDTAGGFTPWNFALNEIWILSNLKDIPDLEYTVAHELRHMWQKKNCQEVFKDPCQAEGDAYPYAYDALKRYLEATGRLTAERRKQIDEKRTSAQDEFRKACPDAVFGIIKYSP